MSFQAYIDNIKAKTGKTPADFKKLAEKKTLSLKESLILEQKQQKSPIGSKKNLNWGTDMQWRFTQHLKEKLNEKL